MWKKMKKKFLILAALILFIVACSPSFASELKVTNLSTIKIYPTIKSGKSSERFGVVAIGKSATVEFSPFRLGDKVEISWEEGESYDLTNETIDTSSLKSFQKNVDSIHLVYTGQRKWQLKAFDKDDRLLGSIL